MRSKELSAEHAKGLMPACLVAITTACSLKFEGYSVGGVLC